jgi:hypothetical protein
MGLIQGMFMAVEPGSAPGGTFWVAYSIVMLLVIFGLPWCQLAITYAVSEAALGRTSSVGGAYGAMSSRYLPYLGTYLLAGLGILVGFLLLIIPGIYLAVSWVMVGALVVIEGLSGTTALKRSRSLVSGHWWHAFGVLFVTMLIGTAITGGFQWAFGFIPVLGPLLNGIVGAIAFVFYAAVFVVLYFDLRCRNEDFDLQLLAQGLGASHAVPTTGAL